MNIKLIFLFILIALSLNGVYAKTKQQLLASSERNFLTNTCTPQQLKEMLIMDQKWVPYPIYNDRDAWNRLLGEYKEGMIERGESFLNYKWKLVRATDYLDYSRTGNRGTMQEPYFANQDAIGALVLAELAEGKGRFMDQIIDGVFMNCEMTSWVLSAHFKISPKEEKNHFPDIKENLIGLFSAQTGAMLSWTYYFLHEEFDKINPLISERLRFEIQKRILDPYMNMNYWWTALPPYPNKKPNVNNWNPWCNANVLQCYMLLENNKDTLAKAVYRSMRSIDEFINFDKDGACDEGPSYWSVAAGKMYDYLDLLEKLTGGKISIFDKPELKAMAEYVYRANVGDGWVVNFADASAKSKGKPYFIYNFGKAVGSQDMMCFAAFLKEKYPESHIGFSRDIDRTLRNASISEELKNTEPIFNVPDFSWYPRTEYCFMSNKQGLFVAAKGGNNNENHNHNDVGTFIFYVDSVPIFIDTGVGSYTAKTFGPERYTIWTMQSNYHNLPLVNGVAQRAGANFKATNTSFDKRKMIFATDIAKAYPKSAEVESWVRTYQLKNQGLSISDRFLLTKTLEPNQINFMTWGDVNLQTPGRVMIKTKGRTVKFLYDDKLFEVNVEPIELKEKKLSRVWGKTIYRLSFKAKSIEMEGRYIFEINI